MASDVDQESPEVCERVSKGICDCSPVERVGAFRWCRTLLHDFWSSRRESVLLDIWIAEGLLLGGSLYLAACNASRADQPSWVLTVFGSLTIIGFTAPMTPVLLSRAPIHFVLLTVIYLLLSLFILAHAARRERSRSP